MPTSSTTRLNVTRWEIFSISPGCGVIHSILLGKASSWVTNSWRGLLEASRKCCVKFPNKWNHLSLSHSGYIGQWCARVTPWGEFAYICICPLGHIGKNCWCWYTWFVLHLCSGRCSIGSWKSLNRVFYLSVWWDIWWYCRPQWYRLCSGLTFALCSIWQCDHM